MSAKNVTVTVASVVVAQAGYINWIQGAGTTYTVAVNAQTDYITVTDTAAYSVATDTLWAAAGDLAYGTGNDTATVLSKGTAGQILSIGASIPAWSTRTTDVTFAKSGTVATTTESTAARWYNDTGRTLTFVSARASAVTAPTGASLKVDVNVDGTTCFVATSQVNRPTIAISGNTNKTTTFDSISTIADGSYLSVNIDQIGSTVAGADLTVTIVMSG
jgi:hypothetical protein